MLMLRSKHDAELAAVMADLARMQRERDEAVMLNDVLDKVAAAYRVKAEKAEARLAPYLPGARDQRGRFAKAAR